MENEKLTSDSHIQEVLSKLKFVSKIKPHEKVNVGSLSIDDNYFFSNFIRYYKCESRYTTLDFISHLMVEAVEICNILIQRDDYYSKYMVDIFLKTIIESKMGITNILITYKDDRMYASRLDIFLETLFIKIEELSKLLKEKNEELSKLLKEKSDGVGKV